MAEIFTIRDLEHFYGQRRALSIDQWSVQEASVVGLVGPNGSGKSTLLRLLALLEETTRGEVIFAGRPGEPPRRQVTLLLQEPFLLKRSVFENVAYGLKVRGEGRGLNKKVQSALELVGLEPAEFSARPWTHLSGGEAQRVALAARLALKPRVLLLDEPTASVDAHSAGLIQAAALKARDDWGATIVLASHDLGWVHRVCDVVLGLDQGRLTGRPYLPDSI